MRWRRKRTSSTRGVDPQFRVPARSEGDSGERILRPVSELLSDAAGASSPFGATSLPMPPEAVSYQHPDEDEKEHAEQTEEY